MNEYTSEPHNSSHLGDGGKRLIVIGGGAAGFFCAVNAAKMNPSLKITIVEKTSKLLSKVRVSGGGRCNVTHACFSMAEMVKKYPRGGSFLKKAFHQFFTTDTIEWFKERGVELKIEPDGRMFPVSNTSQTIVDCLMQEVNKYGIDILMNKEVKALNKLSAGWQLLFDNETTLEADFVCIASGGYPKSIQFEWLQKIGHTVESPVPSLFTFNMPGNPITALMGVVAENVSVKIAGTKLAEQGPLLITHWGMSGPAILKLSAWGARQLATDNYKFTAIVNWVPAYNEQTLKDKFQQVRFEVAAQKISNRNPFLLPQRLWSYLLQQAGINEEIRWADLPAKEQNKLIKTLCTHEFTVNGKTTFKEEFVTAGGIVLSEIDHNTMESKLAPNLFFCGEVTDTDGVTGGFNFQNAWTTGFIAARAIAGR
ncbi:MAG: NAD(P)/FAD-dependent oxidoreductase [Ferruginibacter sp.]|nr:NAD(P)/FAD-dependent oxidoreductase [Ferruginibacter sp.]